jgi:hypothetical protein
MNDDWAYLSRSAGIDGEIKISPEEFIVEEIALDGTILELNKKIEKPDLDSGPGAGEEGKGKFTHFILQKKDWSTSSALMRLSKALRVGQKRFDYAGTKDNPDGLRIRSRKSPGPCSRAQRHADKWRMELKGKGKNGGFARKPLQDILAR